jgi:hypothetical protein
MVDTNVSKLRVWKRELHNQVVVPDYRVSDGEFLAPRPNESDKPAINPNARARRADDPRGQFFDSDFMSITFKGDMLEWHGRDSYKIAGKFEVSNAKSLVHAAFHSQARIPKARGF